MGAGNSLRTSQRMQLMKQQYEQLATSLSPEQLLQQERPPAEQQSAAQRAIQQRIRERLQHDQLLKQQQQDNSPHTNAQPLGVDQVLAPAASVLRVL